MVWEGSAEGISLLLDQGDDVKTKFSEAKDQVLDLLLDSARDGCHPGERPHEGDVNSGSPRGIPYRSVYAGRKGCGLHGVGFGERLIGKEAVPSRSGQG